MKKVKKRIWIVDSNVIISAFEKDDRYCEQLIFNGPHHNIELVITEGILWEITPSLNRGFDLPDYIGFLDDNVVKASVNFTEQLRVLNKEYGNHGSRMEPSLVDKSLIQICLINQSISGIISKDNDVYILWAALNIDDRENFTIKKPNEIFRRN